METFIVDAALKYKGKELAVILPSEILIALISAWVGRIRSVVPICVPTCNAAVGLSILIPTPRPSDPTDK